MYASSQVVTNRDTLETLLCVAYVFEVSTSEHGAQHHIYRLVKDWYMEAQAIRPPFFTTTTTTATTTTVQSTTAPPTDCSHRLLCFSQGWQVHQGERLHSIAVQKPERTRLHYRKLTEREPLARLGMSGHCACCNRHFVFSCAFLFCIMELVIRKKMHEDVFFFFCFLFFNP